MMGCVCPWCSILCYFLLQHGGTALMLANIGPFIKVEEIPQYGHSLIHFQIDVSSTKAVSCC